MVQAPRSSATVDNIPWVEKYRPKTLDDVISQEGIITTLSKFVSENKLPHLLFYGPPGTGKTSAILAIAKTLFPPEQFPSMVLELNASDDRGINIVREQIMNFARTSTLKSPQTKHPKLIILDEADAMTKDAQSALRRVIEKFTDNVRFCIICNYLSKIIPAIQSRCTRFRFAPLSEDQVLPRLQHIVEEESLTMTKDGQKALLHLSQGDMRRVVNVLQSTAMAFDKITAHNVYLCVGQPTPSDAENIMKILLNDSIELAFIRINEMRLQSAFAVSDILTAVYHSVCGLDLPSDVLALLLDRLSEIEYRLSQGCSERVQLGALIGLFIEARSMLGKHAPPLNIS
ncbi:hypothetical protein AB6A40_004751 [Gnathostoma spinigerum]|uniref:Activator 1 subunit 5 n=1 Tax=Gnathostoma spinigerum TaxID=75299 RepID=A0ABD6EFK4_9BILA